MMNETKAYLLKIGMFGVMLSAFLTTNVFAQDKDKKEMPKLAGAWKFNEQASDDVRKKMKDLMPGGFPQGGPPPGGGFPGAPSPEQMKAMQEQMERSLTAPKNLDITQSEAEITIAESGGVERSRTYYFDGRKSEAKDSDKAKFKKTQMVVTTETEQGPKISETYEMSKDNKQLIVTVKVETNFGSEIKLRRVYDAA